MTPIVRPIEEKDNKKMQEIIQSVLKSYRLDIPGTAYFDEVGIKILGDTGQIPMNFSGVIGDADRSLSLATVEKFIRQNVQPGAVLIMHFNHPEGKTLKAVRDTLPEIRKAGYEFVKLVDYRDSLE